MPGNNDTTKQTDNTTNFKCCRTKPFIHYVCLHCLNVFHKSCLARYRKEIKFLKGNKIICCEDKQANLSSKTDDEISTLEKTVSDLWEDSELKNNYIKKLQTEKDFFIQEALKTEDDLNHLIKQQEKLIQELKENINELNRKATATVKIQKTTSTQTNVILTKTVSTSTNQRSETTMNLQTTLNNKVSETHPVNMCDPASSNNNKKILLVSAHHGKHFANLLTSKSENEFCIQSILKPNASLEELIKTALHNSINFTKKDAIILWPDQASRNLKNEFVLNAVHTNPIIITEPYRYGTQQYNDMIYFRNLDLYKALYYEGLHKSCIIECSNILMKSNYSKNGYSVTRKGKWFLSEHILTLVRTLTSQEKEIPRKSENEEVISGRKSNSATEEIQIEKKNVEEDKRKTKNHNKSVQDRATGNKADVVIESISSSLYPRLSQFKELREPSNAHNLKLDKMYNDKQEYRKISRNDLSIAEELERTSQKEEEIQVSQINKNEDQNFEKAYFLYPRLLQVVPPLIP